ncbi:hypothetical protein [Streptomyces chartreusis]|uniref:hypothetical protein n=1 Tax=Streptomyces chartreusis TaxID=1969 RepID=UPI00123E3736|nr:hypothetical protein [Streptomyces chartreusis]QEV66280.1 hypothetical protein CP983_06090 [Streptomyces chartreusis]GGW99209.1 hypothetical protein GCM10010321_12140 [Streptomyces chartreusis]
MSQHSDMDPFWVERRAEFLAAKSTSADPSACGTCRSNVADGKPVEHDGCAQRATLLHAPDHPYYEILAGFSLEENAKLPARFHVPVFDDCGVPNSWLCAVCQEEGVVTGWPCATAIKHGKEVFTPQHEAETAAKKQAARIVQLETALAATGRSLSSFIFDSDDPGADALGAQWLYHQAMPQADDPFAQPRAFRSSVFSEAATEVEKLDGQAPEDRDRSQAYLDGYSDGVQDAAERLEKLADQAAEGSEVTS